MAIRFLINDDGSPFESSELKTLRSQLDALGDKERKRYRDLNASAVAKHKADKILIVSGPGTGKSYLFLDRINHWYQNDSQARVFVTSFVRKLVADLQNDIDDDEKLTDGQKNKISVSTLHKFARSIVEKNHGTRKWPFRPHFLIIGQFWKDVVWDDALAFHPSLDKNTYDWENFEKQLHNDALEGSDEWRKLKETYFKLCKFYNAAGFADLILRAKTALKEKSSLNKDNYFIVDEYQDFNLAEDALITQLVENPKGLLIVGDDEQVLYEQLKSSKATLIRRRYKDKNYINAMLPFDGRSSFCITKVAGHFIQQNRETDCIEKIFLPIKTNDDQKVQIIACATSSTAVDYIEKFIADNKTAIDERKEKLEQGEETEAFLLILTPAKKVNFYGKSKEKIKQIISEYQNGSPSFSEDYYKALSYYLLAGDSRNNFTFRKVLFYEEVAEGVVHGFIETAMQNDKTLCELNSGDIKTVLTKCNDIKAAIDSSDSIDDKVNKISKYISISNQSQLKEDVERQAINRGEISKIENKEEEDAELEELETKKVSAIELMTLVGAKGLSADHVIVIGFDNVNMSRITKNAFYVTLTRARKSLHIITALKSGGARQPHNFLDHLPDQHIEFYSYRKKDRTNNLLRGKQGLKDYIDKISSFFK